VGTIQSGLCEEACCLVSEAPGCIDPAVTDCVCAQDPSCCLQSWDLACVELAADSCEVDCSAPEECCANPETQNLGGGCGSSLCEACVCGYKGQCCNSTWTDECSETAGALCYDVCSCTAPSPFACEDPPGDITWNGETDVMDVQCTILTVLWELGSGIGDGPGCCEAGTEAADLDCDGAVTVADCLIAIQLALSLPLDNTIDTDGDLCHDSCELANIWSNNEVPDPPGGPK